MQQWVKTTKKPKNKNIIHKQRQLNQYTKLPRVNVPTNKYSARKKKNTPPT